MNTFKAFINIGPTNILQAIAIDIGHLRIPIVFKARELFLGHLDMITAS